MASCRGSQLPLGRRNSCTQLDPAVTSPETREWENLSHDLLVLILSKLQFHDLINGSSRACSSWRSAAKDPGCWSHILGVKMSKLLGDIADCGSSIAFWHFLCRLYGGFSRDHSDMVDFVIRRKI